ncbi:MAG: calcineurin-like phosphoesterase C-terminal domain-containing protein [Bacteroidales bacterium]|nr:calcineurin-like phosphoesterase C-terminal domain-containing protein [Bacteroidales bacterium]
MKYRFSLICLAAVCASFFTACTKEELPGEDDSQTVIITATASLPKVSGTKVLYSENDPSGKASGLKSVWEAGDFFYAFTNSGQRIRFDLSSGAGKASASFTASASGISSGTQWTAVLGKNVETSSSSSLLCTYTGQDGSIEGLADSDFIIANGTGATPAFGFAESNTRLSYFLRIKLPAGVRYIEYCTTANWKVTPSANTIQYDGNYDGISVADLGSESSAGDVCYLAVPAIQYSCGINDPQRGVIVTFMNAAKTKSNGKVLSSDLSGKAGQIGTFDVSSMELIDRPLPGDAVSLGARSVRIRKDPDPDFCNKYNNLDDYEYATAVAPAWAPYNLGAKVTKASPTADDLYGDSFMWGETAPRTSFSSSAWTHHDDNAQLGHFETVSVSNGSSNGTMKFQRISGTKYDAARIRWGHDWRMPTIEELVSLVGDNEAIDISADETVTASGLSTKIETIDFYGVGRTVKGRWFSDGTNTVFFPFAGWYGTGHAYYGARAFYWSDSRIRATPSNGSLTNATLRFEMNGSALNYGRNSSPSTEMYYGLSIRPVRSIQKQSASATSPSVWEDVGESTIQPSSNLWGVITDSDGNPIPGITVSDGYSVCVTDVNGTYQMAADSRARTVNVTIPAAYESPMENGRPAFYQYVTIPSTGAVQKDFTLTKRSSVPSRFTILAVTDEHIQKSAHVTKFQTAVDDIQETATTLQTSGIPVGDGGNAGEVIAISLGDQMWDNMSMASSIVSTFTGRLDVPVFFTIGNHDYDSSKDSDYDAETAYVNAFGPTNYSFDIGNAHIIVMDDIIRRSGNGSGSSGYATVNYGEGFTSEQITWLKADIAKVKGAASKIAILCVHAPLSTASGGDTDTQTQVMSALKNNFYNVHVFSGHTHVLKNNYYGGWAAKSGRHIYEHTIQTLSGYFWEADISYHNASPAGYGVYTFDSNDLYAEYNKTTKEDPTFQFWVYNGGETYTRSGKSYSWSSPLKSKFIVKLPDACDTDVDDESWTFTVTSGGSSEVMTRVSEAINDQATHCYISKYLDNTYSFGGGDGDLDVFWYSSRNFVSSGFTITATHTMPSGWSATYSRTHYVNGSTWKGFAYGVRFE